MSLPTTRDTGPSRPSSTPWKGFTMPLIDQPWTRVRQPVPIPAELSQPGQGRPQAGAATLLALEDVELAELIRSHLMPRDQSDAGRRAWDNLWATIRSDDTLADEVYDVLEDFLDTTEEALSSGTLDDAGQSRARKFLTHCQQAWARVDRGREQGSKHLAWAGRAGNFQPAAQRVIATLVGAIARHRATHDGTGSPADFELWETLAKVNLDPDDYATLR